VYQNNVTIIFGKRGSGKTTLAKELIKHDKRLITLDTLGEYGGSIVHNEGEIYSAIKSNPSKFNLSLRSDNEKIFDFLYNITNYRLVIEELSYYCSSARIPKSLLKIILWGRHRKINFMGIAQRPAIISKTITSQATHIYVFNQSEPRDIDYLVKSGFDENAIQKLPQYKYIRKEY
jgi:DNA helicase HerA-like ATPase